MHLERIQVPDFRVLKDVDITFEKEFVPSIFPLGSLNGGGKSTLLQLIFVLLHCSTDSDRKVFLKNILNGFSIYKGSSKRVIAIARIWDGQKTVELEFFSYKDSYITDLLKQKRNSEVSDDVGDESRNEISNELDIILEDQMNDYLKNYEHINFSILERLELIEHKIFSKHNVIDELQKILSQLKRIQEIRDHKQRNTLVNDEIAKLRSIGLKLFSEAKNIYSFEEIQEAIQQELKISQAEFKELFDENKRLEFISQEILQYLHKEKLFYICKYSENEDDAEVLLCHIDNLEMDKAESFFKKLSQKIFLAAPVTQSFLFLSKESRKFLFNEQNNKNNEYYLRLQDAKSKLPSFFAYDFLPVDILVESFKNARDRDFQEAIKTGEYGTNYKELLNELNLVLANKKININLDISGVNFKLDKDGENIELQPEDLSHGELKRLSIYLWIKYHNIENAIVLMDEIEIAFHPDWQYQIISDLQQWAPSNQYILATHSYELCQALTPAHVKELEPKLLKKQGA